MPCIVLASSHECPRDVDRRLPLAAADDLGHGGLRGNGEELVHGSRHPVPRCNTTCLWLSSRAKDLAEIPSQFMVERFPTVLRDTHHMILAVPLGMAESLAVWHDKLPLGGTLSGSPEGVCCFDSRNWQTLRVPRQSRGFTSIKLKSAALSHAQRTRRKKHPRNTPTLLTERLTPLPDRGGDDLLHVPFLLLYLPTTPAISCMLTVLLLFFLPTMKIIVFLLRNRKGYFL